MNPALPFLAFAALLAMRLHPPFDAFMRRAMAWLTRDKRLLAVAFIGGMSGYGYKALATPLWKLLAPIEMPVIAWLLNLFGTPAMVGNLDQPGKPNLLIPVGNYTVYSGCSGMEGLAIMWGLLSLALMLEWERARRLNLTLVYAAAFLTMAVMNIARITAFALYATHMGSSQAMVNTFHSYIGLALYLPAIYCFISVIKDRP